jgi:hypothetical protein
MLDNKFRRTYSFCMVKQKFHRAKNCLQILQPIICRTYRAMRSWQKLIVFFLAATCFAEDLPSAKNEQTPVLKIDDEHFSQPYSTNTAPSYRIPPSAKVIIDATHYTFKPNANVRVNTVKRIADITLIGGGTNLVIYYLPWKPNKTRYELSSATLQASDDSPAFTGFKSGQKWSILIGAEYETNKSAVEWQGDVEVH